MGPSKHGKLKPGLHARFYRGVILRTIYGRLRFDVMDIEPGSGVLVTTEKRVVAAGTRVKGKSVLKEPHGIPCGSVLLRRANHHGHASWSIYEDGIYSARRGVLHALVGYDESRVGGSGGEMRENLKDAAALVEAGAFLSVWRTLGNGEREAVSEALLAFVGKHEDDLDPSKTAATDAIGSVAGLEDRTGRKNPLIVRGQISVAERRLLERVGAIKGIDPRLALRYAVLDREIDLEIGVVRKVRGAITRTLAFIEHDAIGQTELKRLLAARRNSLSLLRVAPFAEPGLVCVFGLNSAISSEEPKGTLRDTEAILAGLAAGHFLHQVVECLSVLPSRPEEVEARVREAKGLVKAFRIRNDRLFPSLGEGAEPAEWRVDFRAGAVALSTGLVEDAKTCFGLAADGLIRG